MLTERLHIWPGERIMLPTHDNQHYVLRCHSGSGFYHNQSRCHDRPLAPGDEFNVNGSHTVVISGLGELIVILTEINEELFR